MFKRSLNLREPLKDLSLILFGPRQTGKSTLIQTQFPNAQVISLLDPEVFRDLNKSPNLLIQMVNDQIRQSSNPIIIDEIQKIPELLDVVHTLIEKNKKTRFVLSGSSARKLKKQGQNLLGGRAYPVSLHPITSHEYFSLKTDSDLNLQRMLEIGGLPNILLSQNPQRLLKAYIGIYLQEEIKAEGFARNLGDFSKFLEVAALTNGEQLDYAGIGRDVQLSPRTVASYYSVLQDTLIGHILETFRETKTRKAVTTPKFYYFDVGVCNHLIGREKLSPGTPEFGKALEHFIFTEIISYRDYNDVPFEIYYWRSTTQLEVDFIIKLKSKKLIGIEVKGTSRVDSHDLKGLRGFEDDFKLDQKIVICNEKSPRIIDDEYQILPYTEFCKRLWAGKIFN